MSVFSDIKDSYENRSAKRREKQLAKIEKQRLRERNKQTYQIEKYKLAHAKQTTRDRKYEALSEKYGRTFKAGKTIKSAGKEALGFAGSLAKEGSRSYGHMKSRMAKNRRIRQPTVRLRDNKSFVAPDGIDISLSGAIAHSDWTGGKNMMNTEFFGERDNRDFLGNMKEKQWNMDIFDSSNKMVYGYWTKK